MEWIKRKCKAQKEKDQLMIPKGKQEAQTTGKGKEIIDGEW